MPKTAEMCDVISNQPGIEKVTVLKLPRLFEFTSPPRVDPSLPFECLHLISTSSAMSTARFARRVFSQVATSSKASRQSPASWSGMGMRRGMASTHGGTEAARKDTAWLVSFPQTECSERKANVIDDLVFVQLRLERVASLPLG